MAAAPVIIPSVAKHTSTLIFLHGLGDTGHGWATSMGALRTPDMKVICPTAPNMPVTMNGGFRLNSWFDLKSISISDPEDEEGIKKATRYVHELIQSEMKAGILSNRIMLGGFSQGGALALYAGLTFAEPLAGVMALSCWLPLHKSFPSVRKCPDTVPVLQCHGDCDPIVFYKFGQLSSSVLKSFMKNSHFQTYQGLGHSSCDAELSDMKVGRANSLVQPLWLIVIYCFLLCRNSSTIMFLASEAAQTGTPMRLY
ncbi:acyl-protein thioesterase 1 isoform X1 [Anopheles gambiae]|uniref:acyl-protein thioesterase 1 isoform X1 n=1 Tax=Anopheles gambiae TaxID=7165 RepID=UPI002AC94039|nr:acyl-protein thioesterase 1 isoform X1 [Anopheles gambiae]